MEYEQVLFECAESFYESTQIALSVVNADGSFIRRFGEPCSYCKQFIGMVGNNTLCEKRHLHGCRESHALGKGYVFSCPAGLVMFASALKQNGKHIYSMIGGPVLPETPNIGMVDEVLTHLALPLTGRALLYSALKAVPMLEPRRIEYLNRLLHNLTRDLLDTAQDLLQKSQEKEDEKSRVQAYLEAIKETPALTEDATKISDLEELLVSAVRMGNKADAKTAMEQMFSIRSICSGMQTKLTTIHAIELLTLLSRTAIEAGAPAHSMYTLTDYAFCRLMEARSINQVSEMLQKAVEDAINKIDVYDVEENTALIRQSIYYIRQHYKENLTLEDVAMVVNLSPSYFSSLFKDRTGMGFISYVNNLKIEAAKKLLSETEMSLADVAMELGFCSQSYFSSVFKKIVGTSPKQYRTKLPA